MRAPAQHIAGLERRAEIPPGAGDRFRGYGVMGLPFRSGHVLALRRFPASSLGPGYQSVWHCDPAGRWTFFQDQPAGLACSRFFGPAVDAVFERDIAIAWTGPHGFEVRVGGGELEWAVQLASTPATRLFSWAGAVLPGWAWHSPRVLGAMSAMAGPALRAGRVRLAGTAPNGQRFAAQPRTIWVASASRAVLRGADLGPMGPAPRQARLGEFLIPQRGLVVAGRATFEPGAAPAGSAPDQSGARSERLDAEPVASDARSMLELRPNCKCCDRDLPPDTAAARICTFECTFCAECAEARFGGVCPNCGGNLVERPARPAAALVAAPASSVRVTKDHAAC